MEIELPSTDAILIVTIRDATQNSTPLFSLLKIDYKINIISKKVIS